ncbi:adhesin, partial [Pseudomonas putida]|uniref:immunoglobulin-like domain-containing protein n=3 Tax=Pseudomonas TaxID=286 RepID=UPI002D1F37BC
GPASAGGNGALGGGHSFVMLEETAGAVDPTIGFPTDPLGFAIAQANEEIGGLDPNGTTTDNLPVATGLTLTATPSITEAGGVIVYTATVGQPPLTNLTVTLSNGAVIVIPAGQTSGSVNVTIAPNDTVYVDGGEISASITGTSGGNGLVVTPDTRPAVTEVTDTIDNTTATLTATPSVSEGGVITYTVTLSNPAQTPVTVPLSNGQTITIKAGETTGTVDFQTPANDVYNNGSTVSTTITGATGGNFEQLTPNPAPAETVITDSVDTTSVTLTATPGITEGGVITYTATLSNPAQTPVTVTLSNGQTITIKAGETTGTVDFQTPANDVYNNGSTVSTTITGATGGNFEQLTPNPAPAETVITDSVDTTSVTLTATPGITEGGVITYTATLSNPAQTPVTVTLSNGQTITIKAGETTGTVDFKTPANDVFVNGSTVSTTITGASGGNFEKLTPNTTPAETQIKDSIDTVTVSIAGNGDVTEAQQPAFTVKISQKLDHDLTVTLSNGDKVVIKAGETEIEYKLDAQGDDVFTDPGKVTLGVTDASVDGKQFEDLQLGGEASVAITDTVSEVKATLSVDKTTVAEGGEITYTVTLSNGQKLPVNGHGGLVFTLSDGTKVSIPAGSASGSITVKASDDVFTGGQPTITNKLESVEGGEKFEKLTLGENSVSTEITDEPGSGTNTGNEGDKFEVTIVSKGDVTEDQQPSFTIRISEKLDHDVTVTLSNNQQVVIQAGKTEVDYSLPAQGDDVFKDAGEVSLGVTDATVAGKQFENLQLGDKATVNITDTISEVKATLSVDKSTVAEGGEITYTVTLSNGQKLPVNGHGGLVFTLTDGTKVSIPAGSASGSITVKAPDDVFTGGQPTITNKLESVEGSEKFEKLTLDEQSVSTEITDEPGSGTNTGNEGDKFEVTIVSKGDVTEDQQPSFTIRISEKLDHDVTV